MSHGNNSVGLLRETAQMFRHVILVFCSIMPLINPLVGAAQAQTAADRPASFSGSLVEVPSQTIAMRQTVYVAAYSIIRLGGGQGKVELATTLSIHNTSEERPLNILRVDYFDTAGNLVHSYLPKPIAIRPFGTVEAFVPAENTRGGTGANFVVEWAANGQIAEPLIEAVMVGTLGAQGFSFTSRGEARATATPR